MKIVIVGAGFGGLKLAQAFGSKKGFDVTLIDRFNFLGVVRREARKHEEPDHAEDLAGLSPAKRREEKRE